MARQQLSPQLRSRICELRSLYYCYSNIHAKYPEISRSTIITTCRREALRNIENIIQPRSGRPRGLREKQRDYIYDIVNHTNPYIKIRDLREIDNIIKKRSIQGLLREMNKKK
jgi:transposase